MTISDLLTILGILLAIFAFIDKDSRDYTLLKFARWHKILLIVLFFLVNFLLAFYWFCIKFPVLRGFIFNGWPPASTYAYIFSVIALSFVAFTIYYNSPFPYASWEKILSYYRRLLLRNETVQLIDLISKHHQKGINSYIQASKQNVFDDVDWDIESLKNTPKPKEKKEIIPPANLGSLVFNRIILDDRFIDSASNIDPYFFLPFISQLNNRTLNTSEFVNRYVWNLIKNKNTHFIREINLVAIQDFVSYKLNNETPILFALMGNIRVSTTNQAWRSLCDEALSEMSLEARNPKSILRETNFDSENQTLWNTKVYIGFQFMRILFKEAIVQRENDFDAFIYTAHILKSVIGNLSDDEKDLYAHGRSHNNDIIYDLFVMQIDLIECIKISKNDQIIESFNHSLGLTIWHLVSQAKISRELRLEVMDLMISNIFHLCIEDESQTNIVHKIQNEFLKLLKQPVEPSLFRMTISEHQYHQFLLEVWDNIDHPNYIGPSEILIDRLKTEVIDIVEN